MAHFQGLTACPWQSGLPIMVCWLAPKWVEMLDQILYYQGSFWLIWYSYHRCPLFERKPVLSNFKACYKRYFRTVKSSNLKTSGWGTGICEIHLLQPSFLPNPFPHPLSLKYRPESNVMLSPIGEMRHYSPALQDVNARRKVSGDWKAGRWECRVRCGSPKIF